MFKEIYLQATQLEAQLQEMQENNEAIEKQIEELEQLLQAISSISEQEDKLMLSPLGSGIYVKTEIKEDSFFINVGSGVFVKKSKQKAKETLEKQIGKLSELRFALLSQIEIIKSNLSTILEKFEKENQ